MTKLSQSPACGRVHACNRLAAGLLCRLSWSARLARPEWTWALAVAIPEASFAHSPRTSPAELALAQAKISASPQRDGPARGQFVIQPAALAGRSSRCQQADRAHLHTAHTDMLQVALSHTLS